MDEVDRRARLREYKETVLPAGIFRVRNTVSGRSLVGSSADLAGVLNRVRFQLKNGSHPDKELQADWNALGADAFAFEVLDLLGPTADPVADLREDLRVLHGMWLEKLAASGDPLYRQSTRGT